MNQQTNTPKLINWAGYLALTLLVILPLSILTIRSGAWQQGLMLYALACLGSTMVLILFILALLLPRFAPWRGGIVKRALAAVPGTALLLSLTMGGDAPRIHDITTDTQDPPLFVAAPQQRGEGSNPLDINPEVIAVQQQAYPDIGTLRSPLSIDEAFDQALEAAQSLGWEIYHQDRNTGVIEAADTTAIMAFTDDVVIRVRGDAQSAIIDLRSVSRVGVGDIGANAKRIRAFGEAFGQ